ncbi:MAG: Spy/CpxP family protein refolding chaperone [Chloracidobacterium sp.]|nr:Spy/CpxP family protein refolding chaperone [Chloracidobacterium sp.]
MSFIHKLSTILTVAVAVFAFSTFTLAQEDKAATPAPEKDKAEKHFKDHKGHGAGRHGMGRGFGHRNRGMMRMMHRLNLTEAQKTQIRSIKDANKPDQTTRDEMRTLFEAKRDGTITAEQKTRFEALKEQKIAKAISVREQILNVLTAEQKAQFEQKKAEMKLRREEFRKQRELRKQTQPAATSETTKEN